MDMSAHDFDIARFISGSEVEQVFARGSTRGDATQLRDDDVDTAVVTLVHADGCLTTIDNSRGAAYGYDQRIEAFGSRAMALSENPLQHSGKLYSREGVHEQRLMPFYADRYAESFRLQLEAFVAAVAGRGPAAVGAGDAMAALEIGLAARASLREGRPVEVAR